MRKLLLSLLLLFAPTLAYAEPAVISQFQPNRILTSTKGGTVLTLLDLYAFANVSASTTDGSIVVAVTGKKIRVIGWSAVAGGTATTLTFNSKGADSGTAISQLFANGANGGEVFGWNPDGWFETNSGEALTVTTGSGSATGINVVYVTY